MKFSSLNGANTHLCPFICNNEPRRREISRKFQRNFSINKQSYFFCPLSIKVPLWPLFYSSLLTVAPPGFVIGGAEKDGVWGGAPEKFSWTTPSTFAINATNAPFIG